MKNLILPTELSLLDKKFGQGLYAYTQASCTVTLTDNGYRIYRPPNYDGRPSSEGGNHNTWGGLVLTPLSIDPNLLVKGRTYIIMFDISGQSSNGLSTFYWTNNMGWGGGGLEPSPSNIESDGMPSNFQGTKTCWYKFTINDEVYKTCTSQYAHFQVGTVYPSYNHFGFGFGYSKTGELGTDLYITNIRMYDLTENPTITPNKNGVLVGELQEGLNEVSFHKSSTINANRFYEI